MQQYSVRCIMLAISDIRLNYYNVTLLNYKLLKLQLH